MSMSEPSVSRHLVHPGPVSQPRIRSISSHSFAQKIRLPAGSILIEAIGAHLDREGIRSAALDLTGLVLGPMQFVMPTYARTPDHVAYYSDTYLREGPVTIEKGTATYGARDGRPFLHGHVLWHDEDGSQRGGHVLPFDCRIGRDCEISYVGSTTISMDAQSDPETNFTLFAPNIVSEGEPGDLIVARIRPNEDLTKSIEHICAQHNVKSGRIISLIGSTVGARFADGLSIDEPPTEILGLKGYVRREENGSYRADITIALIDAAGNIHIGEPLRGENPVLICVEIFIQHQT